MLLGELDIGAGGFFSTIRNLDQGFGAFMGKLGAAGAILGGSFAAFQGLQAVMNGFSETLDLGGTLQDLSTQTGETAGDLVVLRQAFDNAGIGADATGDFILKLQDSISGVNEAGKSTAGALDQLGLSAADLRTKPALDQLSALQKGFEGLDQTTKVQVARDLFGKSGGKALALLGDPEALEQAQKQAGPLAALMDRNVGSFDKLGDTINGLKLNFQEFLGGVLEKVAPTADSIADALGSIDFTGIGNAVGALANIFLVLVDVLASLAPLIDWISKGLGAIVGTADAKVGDRTEALKQAMFSESSSGKTVVSALQKVGGGGGFGSGSDPLLSEQRSQTRLLQRIADKIDREPQRNFNPVPV